MKKKIIIRIRRKNEFNWYWVFFIFWTTTLAITALTVDTISKAFILIIPATILIAFACLYQGFEVIKE